MPKPKVLFLVNSDRFFVSHRLWLGEALRDTGFEVVVAALPLDGDGAIPAAGLRFVPVPFALGGTNPLVEARTVAAVAALYRRERPDVVHQVTVKAVLYGSMAARALRVPTLNAISGLGYVFIDRGRRSLRHQALRAAVKAAYRVALAGPRTRTIFQNPDDMGLFLREGVLAPSQAVLIRSSGVDADRFRASPLDEGPPLVVLPARMLWDKGVGELVEAARRVKLRRPEVRFALVGRADGHNPAAVPLSALEGWARAGVVEWWGHRADMPAVFAQAHLVALPSYREGLPLALVEAAASARACITTDVPGCREAVKHGENGWLVPVRDAASLAATLLEALSSRDELVRRGEAGRRMALAHFGRPAVLAQVLAVYRALLGER